MPSTQKATYRQKKTNLVEISITIGIEKKLRATTIPLLLIKISFRPRHRPRPGRKIDATKEVVKVT